MREMQTPSTCYRRRERRVPRLSPHAVFAAEPPDTVTVVISPGELFLPPKRRTDRYVDGAVSAVPAPTPRKTSSRRPQTRLRLKPTTGVAASIAREGCHRAGSGTNARCGCYKTADIAEQRSRRCEPPRFCSSRCSRGSERRRSTESHPYLQRVLWRRASAAVGTRAPESTGWVLPGVLLGLLAGFGLFVASRFAYWRWAIHRSRCQVDASSRQCPGASRPMSTTPCTAAPGVGAGSRSLRQVESGANGKPSESRVRRR